MLETLLTNRVEVYAYAFFGIVIVLTLVEWAVPRRTPDGTLRLRWFSNVAITIVDGVVSRAVLPLTAIAWAVLCDQRGWGLLNVVDWPQPPAVVITLIALDFAAYGRHYLFHHVPILWRLHRTHHTDGDYDFTTSFRFHPLEVLFNRTADLIVILVIGAPAAAVFVEEITSMVSSAIEHTNVRTPRAVDRMLRLVFVTPDMHAIHHSQVGRESRSNLASVFSWWDRLFGTYLEEPSAGRAGIVFGLREYAGRKHATLPWMLALPFLPDADTTAPTDTPPIGEPVGGR